MFLRISIPLLFADRGHPRPAGGTMHTLPAVDLWLDSTSFDSVLITQPQFAKAHPILALLGSSTNKHPCRHSIMEPICLSHKRTRPHNSLNWIWGPTVWCSLQKAVKRLLKKTDVSSVLWLYATTVSNSFVSPICKAHWAFLEWKSPSHRKIQLSHYRSGLAYRDSYDIPSDARRTMVSPMTFQIVFRRSGWNQLGPRRMKCPWRDWQTLGVDVVLIYFILFTTFWQETARGKKKYNLPPWTLSKSKTVHCCSEPYDNFRCPGIC